MDARVIPLKSLPHEPGIASIIIQEARDDLRAAILQMLPSDDAVIADRVRRAEALLSLIDTRENPS